MGSSGLPFPVTHQKLSLDIKGNKTDLVICSYDDHFLVIATQIGSMGTILHARKEEGMLIQPTFNVSVICGKRDVPMLVACARQLIENISSSGSSRPLVLSRSQGPFCGIIQNLCILLIGSSRTSGHA
ncbi:Proteasome assembly chaperone 3 [Camellia lanceoleosa]|uniref:Proteasome assembly chaperone 3 n=1 Tax=Camellia lanceoleosa TaxID=1840588 RepID=A0ACC0I055_9ERIC|nr:Proteasome assembly chaperone 3 [Camellia lanceoleosa]